MFAALLSLRRAMDNNDAAEVAKKENEVRKLLSKKAPFTALVRSRVQSVWPHDQYFD